jgi:heme-degrading monooxygenase HmoA
MRSSGFHGACGVPKLASCLQTADFSGRASSFCTPQRDPSLTDELIQRVQERGPSSVPEARGFLGLFDRDRGASLGITFFDSVEAIRNSEQAFEDMAQQFPPEMRGSRTAVDVYEVVLHDGSGEGARAARVSSLEGSADRIDESVQKTRDETLPSARELSGFKGAIGLADRQSGRLKLITLWESAQALRATEGQADRLRQEAAERGGQRIVGVDRYEVAVAQQLSAVTT